MNEGLDYSVLNWVKKELDDIIKQAQQALETFVDSPDDVSLLDPCVTNLHQVYGTLQMLEMYGASMLAEELETVTQALRNKTIKQQEDTCEVMMRGLLQLPDYLERLQGGQVDMPIVLLPLLNDLRSMRNAPLLSEGALFSINLDVDLTTVAAARKPVANLAELARKLRHPYQIGLLGWFRDRDPLNSLRQMGDAINQLAQGSSSAKSFQLWWVTTGLIDALVHQGLESSVTVKLLLGQVDRQIKRLLDQGETRLAQEPAVDLIKNELYYIARAKGLGNRVLAVKQAFKLDALLPQLELIDQARANLSGPNKEILATVSNVIKEDLSKVKDILDIFVRGDKTQLASLEPLVALLHQTADTLGMLGLGLPRKVSKIQADILAGAVAGTVVVDEIGVMQIANGLLFIESSLDNLVGYVVTPTDQGNEVLNALERVLKGEVQPTGKELVVSKAEYLKVLVIASDEAIKAMHRAKDIVTDYSRHSTEEQRANLVEAGALFDAIKGMLVIAELSRAATLMTAVNYYLATELIANKVVPDAAAFDTLADAIASIEFYIEAVRDERPHRNALLDLAEISAEKLGYLTRAQADIQHLMEHEATVEEAHSIPPAAMVEPVVAPAITVPEVDIKTLEQVAEHTGDLDLAVEEPAFDIAVEDMVTADETAPEPEVFEPEPKAEIMPESEPELLAVTLEPEAVDEVDEVPAVEPTRPKADSSVSSLAIIGEETDAEMLEIFTEEAEEELASLQQQLPLWQHNLEDPDAVATIRRSFHTLKGSGRLVGAMKLGEYAWSFENLLNQVIEGKVVPTTDFFSLLYLSLEGLKQLLREIKQGTPLSVDVCGLMQQADAFSNDQAHCDTTDSAPVATVEAMEAETPSLLGIPVVQPALAVIGDDLDDEMREIFTEELQEELASLQQQIPIWQKNSMDKEALATIRRSFHTLKGSGRLVGALLMGEFAWAYERLLNQVIEGRVAASPAVFALLQDSLHVLPQMIEQIKGGPAPDTNLQLLMDRTNEVADGHSVEAKPSASIPAPKPAVSPQPSPQPKSQAPLPPPRKEQTEEEALLEVFKAEAEDHLQAIEMRIQQCRDEMSTTQAICDDAVIRAFHTLQGSAKMSGAHSIGELGRYFEDFARQLRNQGTPLDEEILTLFSDTVGVIRRMVVALPSTVNLFDYTPLLERIESIQERTATHAAPTPAVPGALPLPELDEFADIFTAHLDRGMVDIFLEDGMEVLATSSRILEAWMDHPTTVRARELQQQMEALHGGAKMAGLTPVSQLTQTVAQLMTAIDQGRIVANAAVFDLLQRVLEKFYIVLDHLKDNAPIKCPRDLLNELKALTPGVETAHSLPSAAGAPAVKDSANELMAIFLEESAQNLAASQEILHRWMRKPDAKTYGEPLLQELNTLQGAAQMAGFEEMGDLIQALSTLLTQRLATETRLTSDELAVLDQGLSQLAVMLEQIRAGQDLSPAEEVLQQVQHCLTGDARHTDTDEEILDVFSEPEPEPEPMMAESSAWDESPEHLTTDEMIDTVATDDQVMSAALDLDPELVDIFLQEADDIWRTLDQQVNAWQQDTDNREYIGLLQRDLHTLKGGARMAELLAIGDLAHAMETYLVEMDAMSDTPSFKLLQRAVDSLADMLDQVKRNVLPNRDIALIQELTASQHQTFSTSPRADADDLDFELVDIFLEESFDIVERIDTALQDWRANSGDMAALELLKRDLHTLKGGSRMAGLGAIGDLCHAMESFVDQLENGVIVDQEPAFDTLQNAADHLAVMLDEVKIRQIPESATHLIAQLQG